MSQINDTIASSRSPIKQASERKEFAFPGPQPGLAQGIVEGRWLRLENKIMGIVWDLSQGLRLAEARDKISGETWVTGNSECIQLAYFESPSPKKHILRGSQMQIVGQPELRTIEGNSRATRNAERYAGCEILIRLKDPANKLTVEWRATLRDEANYVRQSIVLRADEQWVELHEVVLLDAVAKQGGVAGVVDGSPVVSGNWFMGIEHPMSKSEASNEQEKTRILCRYPFAPPLSPRETQEYSLVFGLVPQDQLRRGFLYYIERERAQPYRPFLHHAPGEDSAVIFAELKDKPAEIEKFVVQQEKWWNEIIEKVGQELSGKRGVVIDCFEANYVWDEANYAWDGQPFALWQFAERMYPNGFALGRTAAEKWGACLGVWYSPDAVTGGVKRVEGALEQRFEGYRVGTSNQDLTLGLSLSGPRYFARFRASAVNMLRQYGVRYYKFDGIADGYKGDLRPTGAGSWASDVEAELRVFAELRALDPAVFINWSTGSWPSPFGLRWADCVWHQGHDIGPYGDAFHGWGKGAPRQRWLTYRDSATYNNGIKRSPLYPLNSYMLHGLEFNSASLGGARTRVRGLDHKDIVDEIRSYFATGVNLQEMYLTISLTTDEAWDVIAEAAKWSRANADVLVDTHWIGGDPAKLEVYGWASWVTRRGILTLRNPDDQPKSIKLDIGEAFELPEKAPSKYRLISPWRDEAGKSPIEISAGVPYEFELQAFEVMVLEAEPI